MTDAILAVGLTELRAAAVRLSAWVHRTPVVTSRTLDERAGARVVFKCENVQRAGAFKFRGAMNTLLQLGEAERRAGVVTHSSGNHAQALALAGRLLGIPVCVVMPRTAPPVKRAATEGYGARIVFCEPTLAAREASAADLIARHGYTLVHPFDDWRVIAGQGTAALELHEQAGPFDLVLCPVGGGGLLSGTALALAAVSPATDVVGAEPAAADDARQSLECGRIVLSGDPQTIADGLRTSLSSKTFAVLRRHVRTIVTVSEADIRDAMRWVWERQKLVIEPSSAVAVAPLLTGRLDVRGKRVGVIISGGNVDLGPYFDTLGR